MAVADSATGSFAGDRLPNQGPWVTDFYKAAIQTVEAEDYSKGWVRAQHDSNRQEFLALYNKEADARATEALQSAKHYSFPFTESPAPGSVFHAKGVVLVFLFSQKR